MQDTFIDIYYIYFLKLHELAALKQAYDVNYDQVVHSLPSLAGGAAIVLPRARARSAAWDACMQHNDAKGAALFPAGLTCACALRQPHCALRQPH